MSLVGNKGEWSEIYVLLKLLSEGHLKAGDDRLNPIEGVIYPIITILREHTEGMVHYNFDNTSIHIHIGDDEPHVSIPTYNFAQYAAILLNRIPKLKRSDKIDEVEGFLERILCTQVKAKSSSKADIHIKIHDYRIGAEPTLGFSIKSHMGGRPTLLNASKATNLRFDTGLNLTERDRRRINDIDGRSKIKDRIDEIRRIGGDLTFLQCENTCFENNLMMIDTMMPRIIAELLKLSYVENEHRIKDLVCLLDRLNPFNLDLTEHSFYKYKVKKLLVEIALGLQPSVPWSGVYDATGGYIVVKDNGDLVCYHFYNRNLFEDYLFENTRFDTPSSHRYNFGVITEENNFLLNTQIRFGY